MMLILPWLLGTGVTTAAIGDEDQDVAQDDAPITEDIVQAAPDADQGDFIQDFISAETIMVTEEDAAAEDSAVVWQDVVISFESDDALAGGIGFPGVSEDTPSVATVEIQDADLWSFVKPAEEAVAPINFDCFKDADFLFSDALDDCSGNIETLVESMMFEGVSNSDALDIVGLVEDTTPAYSIEVLDAVEDDVAIEINVEATASNTAAVDSNTSSDADVSIVEMLQDDLAQTDVRMDVDFSIFDQSTEATTETAAEQVLETMNLDIQADLSNMNASTVDMIRDFIVGEDILVIEATSEMNPVIQIEDDGEGNARVVVDGRHVAIVAAAAATITPQDLLLLRGAV